MNKCKTCKWRKCNYSEYNKSTKCRCENPKIREMNPEDDYWDSPIKIEDSDELVYSYDEGGYFRVGENFGCVHWKEKTGEKTK